jgi:hypothetical protein
VLRIPSLAAALVVSSAAWLLAGCGTTSTTPASASDAGDGAPTQEAGPSLDATVDAADSATTDDAATDAGDPAACVPLAPNACLSCCQGIYPAGYLTFGKLELTCACTADFCGALDGGADGGDAGSEDGGALDAGPFGTVACGTTCSAAHTSPDDTCLTCLRATLGSTAAPGPCGIDVLSGCVNDTDCDSYFSCVEACPN